MLHAKDALIAWTPGTDQIRVDILPYLSGSFSWADEYEMSSGAAYSWVRTADPADEAVMSFLKAEFISCVVRDRVPLQEAFLEFSKIIEFRAALPEDMPYPFNVRVCND